MSTPNLVTYGVNDIFVAKTGINVGVQELASNNSNGFDVYPNPSSGELTINYFAKENTSVNIRLSNINGQQIYSEQKQMFIGNFNQSLDLSKDAKGIYFLEIITDKETFVRKIVLN